MGFNHHHRRACSRPGVGSLSLFMANCVLGKYKREIFFLQIFIILFMLKFPKSAYGALRK